MFEVVTDFPVPAKKPDNPYSILNELALVPDPKFKDTFVANDWKLTLFTIPQMFAGV